MDGFSSYSQYCAHWHNGSNSESLCHTVCYLRAFSTVVVLLVVLLVVVGSLSFEMISPGPGHATGSATGSDRDRSDVQETPGRSRAHSITVEN
jgi:hypothetical protein